MSLTRMPLTIWAFFVTAIIGVISFPVLLSAALLLIMDRSFGTSFFLSDIFIQGEVLHYQGGSPVLFEHLFFFECIVDLATLAIEVIVGKMSMTHQRSTAVEGNTWIDN